MGASSDNGMDNTGDDTPAQHSSKLSLGSSPSVLSGDEDDDDDDDGLDDQQQHDTGGGNSEHFHSGDDPLDEDQDKQDNGDFYGGDDTTFTGQDVLTPTDKLMDEEDIYDQHEHDDTDKTEPTTTGTHNKNEQHEEDDDMDDLFDGPLLPSTGDLDDINMDQDSASPLSSVPDDFPLSRSVSPELQDHDDDNEQVDDPLLLLATSSTAVAAPALPNSPSLTSKQPQQSVSSSASTASVSSSSPSTSPPPPSSSSGPTTKATTTITTNGAKRKHNSNNRVSESNDDGDDDGDRNEAVDQGNMFDKNKSTAHSIKSRRLSMTGRDIYNRSSMTGGLMGDDDTIEEKDEEDDEEEDDDDDHEEEEDEDERNTHTMDTNHDQTSSTNNTHGNRNSKATTVSTLKNSTSSSSSSSSSAPSPSPLANHSQQQQEGDNLEPSTSSSPQPPQPPSSSTQQDSSSSSDQGPRDTNKNEQGTMQSAAVAVAAPNQSRTPSHADDSDINNIHHGTQSTLYEETERTSTNEEDNDNQQRHKEALEALTHIEVEFARLRDKMYQEKMAELNEEAIMIANGTHPELVTLMTEIEEKKGRRIRTAEAWRKYQHANFEQQFEGFEYQANVHFISRKSSIRRELLASTNGKRWRLDDEQGKLNDPLQKPGKLLPDAHTLRMQKQRKREETMDLQHIKDVIGFPRAPQVPDLSSQDIRNDLLLLGLGPSRPR